MPETHAFSSIPTKILVPIDFSPSSHEALDVATALALHFNAELYLLHVIPEFPTTTFPDFVPEENLYEEAAKVAEKHFAVSKHALAAKNIAVTAIVEKGTDVAGTIEDVAEREHIDMLVISTHGITGWHPLVFGSIAEKVMKLASCPLLLLRSPKPESSVKISSGRLMEWW